MNILARTGVPGLVLWVFILGAWSAMLLATSAHARMRNDNGWANFFVLVFCYTLAILIDALFSLPLEGPMLGIWFWSLFGVGIGASMIYRAYVRGAEQGTWRATTQTVGST